ncbi:DUF6864 domain-containing function [Pedobacter antarcticus]|uniref:DUF6864 domain-containing function n=1 Tax=Pedobacter antarcticus TaxID=34086 RepID=UPI00292F3A6E|nr:hypothetical protein [Pedobacter antarcticus]
MDELIEAETPENRRILVKETAGTLDVVYNGNVHILNDYPVKIEIQGLTFHITFENREDSTTKIEYKPDTNLKKTMVINFVNFVKQIGIGNKRPTRVGKIQGRALYMSFYVVSPNDDLKVINYVVYLGEKING